MEKGVKCAGLASPLRNQLQGRDFRMRLHERIQPDPHTDNSQKDQHARQDKP